MTEQIPHPVQILDQRPSEQPLVGRRFWRFWGLWVVGLTVVGALSYCLASLMPWADYTLPPAAMLIFGCLAGGVQGFALRQHLCPTRSWVRASALAGFVAACISALPTGLAETSGALYAAWAYAWAAYGAVLGLALHRAYPGRWWMLTSIAGWATAGILSGAVGWISDVLRVSGTMTTLLQTPAALSRSRPIGGLMVIGAVCGATGGAITATAFVLRSRLQLSQEQVPAQERMTENKQEPKLTKVAGVISGLIAAVLCTFVAPLLVTIITQGSLESLDMSIFFIQMLAGSFLCIPTYAIVSIPLGIGCGRVGLAIAQAGQKTDVRPWIWGGAAVGGVAGYVLCSLVAWAIGQTG